MANRQKSVPNAPARKSIPCGKPVEVCPSVMTTPFFDLPRMSIGGYIQGSYLIVAPKRIVDMSRFLFGMITGAALLFVAMHYHIVRGKDGVFVVPKISNNLSDVYVDTRQFDLGDWKSHKPLAAAIMQSDRSDLLQSIWFTRRSVVAVVPWSCEWIGRRSVFGSVVPFPSIGTVPSTLFSGTTLHSGTTVASWKTAHGRSIGSQRAMGSLWSPFETQLLAADQW